MFNNGFRSFPDDFDPMVSIREESRGRGSLTPEQQLAFAGAAEAMQTRRDPLTPAELAAARLTLIGVGA